jgi:CHASE3 domain sensor protein
MAFPLGAVLAAAPGVISAAADIIRVIKENKKNPVTHDAQHDSQRLDEMTSLIERQAQVIEELARNNSNLALAVRNNRILSAVSIVIGVSALMLSIVL